MSQITAEKMKKMTLSIPESAHRTIKAQAALRGQTMRDFILERTTQQDFPVSQNIPNDETIAAMKEDRSKLKTYKNAAKMMEDLLK